MAAVCISIHALLAESDDNTASRIAAEYDFYPRSPCGERLSALHNILELFPISIHALLAESDLTIMLYDSSAVIFLSTLSLRRATVGDVWACRWPDISIHALLAESDCQWRRSVKLFRQFLSTLSLRRATVTFEFYNNRRQDFYPRSPCGERPLVKCF